MPSRASAGRLPGRIPLLGAVSLSFRVAVRVGVMFGGLFRVMLGMKGMTVGYVAVVTGLLMICGFVMFRRHAMMARGMLMVFCCLTMMFSCLFRHRILSLEVQNESRRWTSAQISGAWLRARHEVMKSAY